MKTKHLFFVLAAIMTSNVSANLLTNGSFETGNHVNNGCNYMAVAPGSTALDGWDISAEVAWGVNTCDSFSGSDGVGYVDLSSFAANSLGQISQDVALTIGAEYVLSYDTFGGAITLAIDGVDTAPTDTTAGGGGYTTRSLSFIATNSLTTVSFTNNAPGNTVVFIDNVRLTATPVPLPGALVLLGSALASIGIRKRP